MKTTLLTSAAMMLALAAGAQAQTAQSDAPVVATDVIVVTGFRGTLSDARALKRSADGIVDSIVAEDIAKFPDLNLAESLQRVAGVAITREAGEGRRVSLRGLGPDFTRVQLNGMEVLGNVDSPMDSRGQNTRDRAFDFNIFASELFTRIDIEKSYRASQTEGGLAGTVGLYTARPFDTDGFNAAFSAQGGTNTATQDFSPRLAGLISQNWDGRFGLLVSVAYSDRGTEEQGYNTYRWRALNASRSDISRLSPADQAAINSGQLRFARGNRLSVWESQQERLGVTFAAQWAPSDSLTVSLDALYGAFEGDRDELHLAARGAGSAWLGGTNVHNGVTYGPAVINEIRYNSGNEVIYLDISNANTATETRRQIATNTFEQVVLSADWTPTDRLTVNALIGVEESDYDVKGDKFYLESYGRVTSDYSRERFYAYNTFAWDTADAANWWAHEIDLSDTTQRSGIETARLDAEYRVSDALTARAGFSLQSFANKGYTVNANNLLQSAWQNGTVNDDVRSVAQVYDRHKDQSWTIVDLDAAYTLFGVDRDAAIAASRAASFYIVEEETRAAYGEAEWTTDIAGLVFRGNAGVRYFETEIASRGVVNGLDTTATRSYDDVLPTLNAVLELTEATQVRFAASRNVTRPALGALAIGGTVRNVGTGATVELEATSGNVGLRPYESTNFDLGVEHYFGDVGMVGAGVFWKSLDGFVGRTVARNVPYSDTGLPLELLDNILPAGATASGSTTVAQWTRPANLASTDLTGVEFFGQSDFFFLPAPFNKAGAVANVTLVSSELDYSSVLPRFTTPTVFSLEGLSDTTANVTLYYETELYGARLSANYRSDYVAIVGDGGEEDHRGFNPTTYVDFSAFYQIGERMKWTFDAINLTDEREEQYSDSARRLYNSTTSGVTVYTGINFQF